MEVFEREFDIEVVGSEEPCEMSSVKHEFLNFTEDLALVDLLHILVKGLQLVCRKLLDYTICMGLVTAINKNGMAA